MLSGHRGGENQLRTWGSLCSMKWPLPAQQDQYGHTATGMLRLVALVSFGSCNYRYPLVNQNYGTSHKSMIVTQQLTCLLASLWHRFPKFTESAHCNCRAVGVSSVRSARCAALSVAPPCADAVCWALSAALPDTSSLLGLQHQAHSNYSNAALQGVRKIVITWGNVTYITDLFYSYLFKLGQNTLWFVTQSKAWAKAMFI